MEKLRTSFGMRSDDGIGRDDVLTLIVVDVFCEAVRGVVTVSTCPLYSYYRTPSTVPDTSTRRSSRVVDVQ